MDINNPHDKMFKILGQNKENAADLIKGIFPQDILERLELDSLALDSTSYIDNDLKEYYSDLVFNCLYLGKHKIKIALLFEHKSYVPAYPNLQILKYMVKIWESNVACGNALTPVIPVIFYHGKDEWKIVPFSGLFKGLDKTLERFSPEFEYLLADLGKYSDEDIKQKLFHRDANKLTCLLMKHIFNEDFLIQEFEHIFVTVKNYIETGEGANFLISALTYVFSATELDNNIVTEKIKNISERGGKIAMTAAMKLKEEGIKDAKKEDAKKMLNKGYPITEISEITGLTKDEIEKLK